MSATTATATSTSQSTSQSTSTSQSHHNTSTPLLHTLLSCSLIDCTHTLKTTSSFWPGESKFVRCPFATYSAHGFSNETWEMACNLGTHLDSPAHRHEGKRTVDQITMKELVSAAVVIDVTKQSAANPDYELSVEDITNWEKEHGPIPDHALICMRTGFGNRFQDPTSYRNANPSEPHSLYSGGTMHFPGFSVASVKYLIEHHPSFVGIGIDTLSLDPGATSTFPVHDVLLGSDRYQLENVYLSDLPESGAVFVALPFKVHEACEAPTRILAFVPPKVAVPIFVDRHQLPAARATE